MINLSLPSSLIFHYKDIPPRGFNNKGVYCFYSQEGILLYIGKTKNINDRVYNHFQSSSHTNVFKYLIQFIEFFQFENDVERDIYETFLINKWKPLFNNRKVSTYQNYMDLLSLGDFKMKLTLKELSQRVISNPYYDEEKDPIKFCRKIEPPEIQQHDKTVGNNTNQRDEVQNIPPSIVNKTFDEEWKDFLVKFTDELVMRYTCGSIGKSDVLWELRQKGHKIPTISRSELEAIWIEAGFRLTPMSVRYPLASADEVAEEIVKLLKENSVDKISKHSVRRYFLSIRKECPPLNKISDILSRYNLEVNNINVKLRSD